VEQENEGQEHLMPETFFLSAIFLFVKGDRGTDVEASTNSITSLL